MNNRIKVYNNRAEMFSGEFPSNAIGCEVGVFVGNLSRQFLKLLKPSKLHLIDYWKYDPAYAMTEILKVTKEDFEATPLELAKLENTVVHIGNSHEVYKEFPDAYFDWVYLDADHSYDGVKKDLENFHHKVKPGGIIAGHDCFSITVGNCTPMYKTGVVRAVFEFVMDGRGAMTAMSAEGHGSFCIRVF